MLEIRLCHWALTIALLALGNVGAHAEGTGHPLEQVQPSADLTPADVIRYQVDALADNDVPHADAGIEITFRFASPENRRVTGPLHRFRALLHNPLYSDLLNHVSAEYGNPMMRGHMALGPVLITTADGRQVGYMFQLSKQLDERCPGCWMTEGVTRLDAGAADPGRAL